MINYREAMKILETMDIKRDIITISLFESYGYVLAEDIIADIDMPLFDKSAMDGIALNYNDLEKTKRFRIVDEIAAGKPGELELNEGEAIRIMTGAPVLAGDTVIRKEYIENYDKSDVIVVKEEKKGSNIAYKGEDFKKGDVVIKNGTLINDFVIGAIATLGKMNVSVYKKPSMIFYATGDEVYEPYEKLPVSGIRNSNAYSIVSYLLSKKYDIQYGGILKDEPHLIKTRLERALLKYDILILSGGVSEGNYDFIPTVVKELGFEIIWHKMNIKPGKPQLFAKKNEKMVFGLPGNPVSSTLAVHLFVEPAIKKIMGYNSLFPPFFVGKLVNDVKQLGDRYHFVSANVSFEDGNFIIEAIKTNGSGDIAGAGKGNAFVVIPPKTEKLDKNNIQGFFVK